MMFDRLRYVDRLVQAGVEETVARAQAEALRDALEETVATKDDIERLERKLEHKIELLGRDLIIKGASMGVVLAGLLVGLKVFG